MLRDAAGNALGELGLTQRGRSRMWLDDRTWHVIIVNFSPSGWSKGSYLDVAAMWLWHVKDDFSFDYGNRAGHFERADDGGWAGKAQVLAERAADRVRELRAEIADLPAARKLLDRSAAVGGWPRFHAAISNGLVGEWTRARSLIDDELAVPPTYDWEREKNARLEGLLPLLDDPERFRSEILDDILRSRDTHGLAERSRGEVRAALETRAQHGVAAAIRRGLAART